MSLEQSIQNLADAIDRAINVKLKLEGMPIGSDGEKPPAKKQAKPAVKKAKNKTLPAESTPQDEPPKGKPYWDKTIRTLGKTLIEEQGIKAFVAVLATFGVPNVTKLMEGDESKFPEAQALLEKTLGKKLEGIAD